MKIKFHFVIFIGLVLFASCKRNSDKPLWDIDVLTPLVQSSLTLSNIIKDDSIVTINGDQSITIVSRQELASVSLDSLVTLSTPPFSKTATVNSLVLDTRTDTTRITIGQIADQLIATNDPDNITLGNGIKLAAAFGIPVDLSSIPALTFSNIPIDANSFFQEAEVATGTLTLKIVNTLPADIQTLDFTINNSSDNSLVINNTFNNIPAYTGSATATQNLAGKHVEGNMKANINTLQVVGPTNAVVTLDQAIIVVMTISGVTVNSATAVFPDQDIVQNEDEAYLTGMDDVLLRGADIESGIIRVEVHSTIQDKLFFNYQIPGAVKDGVSFLATPVISAAPAGGSTDTIIDYDFTGYTLDLRGENLDTFNTIFNKLTGSIEYTGLPVSLSLSDYVTVNISTINLKPSGARGYLGRDTVNLGPGFASIDIFKGIESGTLNFENVDIKLSVENGFGLDGDVVITDLSSYNSRTGQSQTLSGLPVNLSINRAVSQGTPVKTSVTLGSSATNLINILPDKVGYSAQVRTNNAGNTNSYSDFAYKTDKLKAFLDIEMPLSIIASQLVLSDTAEFNTAAIQKKNVNSGTFKVFVNNGFPLSATLKMYFLNAYGTVVDSVKSLPDAIAAAPVDGAFRVTEKRTSQVVFEADEETMNNLYNSTKVIFKIQFTTEPAATFMKIYSDYSIDFKMVGDMDYSVYKR